MRLIDADALRDLIDGGFDIDFDETPEVKAELLNMIDDQETIDAAPIRRGKWVVDEFGDTRCSECDGLATDSQEAIFEWCPYCGARME